MEAISLITKMVKKLRLDTSLIFGENYTVILLKKYRDKMASNNIWPHTFLTLFFMVLPFTANVPILITVSPFLLTHVKLLILQKLILKMSIMIISKSHYS